MFRGTHAVPSQAQWGKGGESGRVGGAMGDSRGVPRLTKTVDWRGVRLFFCFQISG